MDRWILCAALLVPTLASAFEVGDEVVCIRSCEGKDEHGNRDTYLPGEKLTISAVKGPSIESRALGGWLPANCVIAAKDAIPHFERRLMDNPDDIEARCGLADLLTDNDQDQALAQADEAVRRKETWLTLYCKALVHYVRNEHDEAQAAVARGIDRAPDQARLRLLQGTLWRKKDPIRAMAEFDLVVAGKVDRIEGLRLRSMAWDELKDWENALADVDKSVGLRPKGLLCLEMRLVMLVVGNKPYRALADVEAILQIEPRNSKAFRCRGGAHMYKQEFAAAIEAFSQALEIGIESPELRANALAGRAMCFVTQEELDKAFDDYTEAIRIEPTNAQHWGNRAYVWHRRKDHLKAIADTNEAIRLDPDSATWISNRGASYLEMCEYRNAVDDSTHALGLDETNFRARSRLALIYAACPDDSLRDEKKAMATLLPLMQREKNSPDKSGAALSARTLVVNVAVPGYLQDEVRVEHREIPASDDEDDIRAIQDSDDKSRAALVMRAAAAALAAQGYYHEAIRLERLEIAATEDEEDRRNAKERLALYEAGKPYRLPTKKR